MKQIVMGIVAASLVVTSAVAADLAAKPYVKAPAVVDPVWSWTGFYAGLNAGYSWGRAETSVAPIALPFPAPQFGSFGQNVDGWLAGGQLGYNWQVDPKWVVGLEGDIQATGERSSRTVTTTSARYGSNIIGIPGGTDFNSIATLTGNLSYDLQWFATFRGRVGILSDPQTLWYATGGLAVGEFKYSSATTLGIQVFGPGLGGTTPLGAFNFPIGAGVTSTDTRVGWTVGAGVERKFTRNWSAKLEYLYMDFGSKTYFVGTANQADVSFRDHVLRVGFNYAFTPTPVVAKY
ncbi:outer membrane protein [Bradyrhizobium ottawaense]|uniref:outer membrane protein n=1 Tax=Bradyrhizobium ottawaense TaxID=931866 RepID=UPI0030C67384